jgi:hypothetical protein
MTTEWIDLVEAFGMIDEFVEIMRSRWGYAWFVNFTNLPPYKVMFSYGAPSNPSFVAFPPNLASICERSVCTSLQMVLKNLFRRHMSPFLEYCFKRFRQMGWVQLQRGKLFINSLSRLLEGEDAETIREAMGRRANMNYLLIPKRFCELKPGDPAPEPGGLGEIHVPIGCGDHSIIL